MLIYVYVYLYVYVHVWDLCLHVYTEALYLTIFEIGGREKAPNQFFPCNFYKRSNYLPKLGDSKFEPFYHSV